MPQNIKYGTKAVITSFMAVQLLDPSNDVSRSSESVNPVQFQSSLVHLLRYPSADGYAVYVSLQTSNATPAQWITFRSTATPIEPSRSWHICVRISRNPVSKMTALVSNISAVCSTSSFHEISARQFISRLTIPRSKASRTIKYRAPDLSNCPISRPATADGPSPAPASIFILLSGAGTSLPPG